MNNIHPTAIIGKNVELGDNNYIGPFCYISGNTHIGNNNRFEAFCSIGSPAEHRDYFFSTDGSIEIGSDNVVREYCTINAGTIEKTILKSDIVMLKNSHIGHDAIIYNNVTLSCNVLVGGHSILFPGCNFGLGALCHQHSVIGHYAMVGMGAIVTKTTKILPGNIYVGNPAKYLKANEVGLSRNSVTSEKIEIFISEFEKACESFH